MPQLEITARDLMSMRPAPDLRAYLIEAHRERRARMARAADEARERGKEPELVTVERGQVSYVMPKTVLAEMRREEEMRLISAWRFSVHQQFKDYRAKDELYERRPHQPMPDDNLVIPGLTIRRIARMVAQANPGVTVGDIYSPRRDAKSVTARHEVCWLAKRHTTFSLPQIGRALGGRDHTTAINSVKKFEAGLVSGKYRRTVFIDPVGSA